MAFKKYKASDGNSPVTEYETGLNFVRVRFGKAKNRWKADKTYQWTAYGIGDEKIAKMKKLAEDGKGLEAYILRNCAKSASRIY